MIVSVCVCVRVRAYVRACAHAGARVFKTSIRRW